MEFKTLATTLLSLIAGAAIAFAFARIGKNRDNKKQESDLDRLARDRLNVERDARLARLELQVAISAETAKPLAAAYAAFLISKLTHFHYPELDELMSRCLPPSTLTQNEHIRMATLLVEREDAMVAEIDESEKLAARSLPYALLIARIEYEHAGHGKPVELVMVIQPVTEKMNGEEERKFDVHASHITDKL